MVKAVLLSVMMTLTFTFASVGVAEPAAYAEPVQSLQGYMVIEDHVLYLDRVEIITLEDTERIAQLGLTPQNDLPNGYHIHNAAIDKEAFTLTEETVYDFVDAGLLFVTEADGNRHYTTTRLEEFVRHLETSYGDTPPAQMVPFFIEVRDGKVLRVTERFAFTI